MTPIVKKKGPLRPLPVVWYFKSSMSEKERLQVSGSCSTNDPHLQVQLILQGFRFSSVVPSPQNLPSPISGMLPVENASVFVLPAPLLFLVLSGVLPGTRTTYVLPVIQILLLQLLQGEAKKKKTQQMRDEQQQRNTSYWIINSFHHFCLPHTAPPGRQPDSEHSLWPPVMDPADKERIINQVKTIIKNNKIYIPF